MKELFDEIAHIPLSTARHLRLLDTCFVIDLAKRRKLHLLLDDPVALTSFTVAELLHVMQHIEVHAREDLRHFLKKHPELTILDVPVVPGDWEAERDFVEMVDSSLLQKIHDPSDAVIAAAALATSSDLYTRDKHHLFTTMLENYFQAAGISVYKEWS